MSDSKLNHETFSLVPLSLNFKEQDPNPAPVSILNSVVHTENDVPSTFIFEPTSKIFHKEKGNFIPPEVKKNSRLNSHVDKKVKVKSSSSPVKELHKVDNLQISAKSLGLNNNSRSHSHSPSASNSTSPSPLPKKYRESGTVNAGETFKQFVSSSPKAGVSNSKSRTKTSSLEFENEVSRVKKAIKDGHIFEIRGVVNSAVRDSLLKRGWIEKRKETWNGNGNENSNEKPGKFIVSKTRRSLSQHHSPNHRNSHNETAQNSEPPKSKSNSSSKSKPKSKSSSNLKSRSTSKSKHKLTSEIEIWTQEILSRLPPNLIWTDNRTEFSWKNIPSWQYVNKLPQSGSVEKRGILDRLQTLQWFSNEVGTGSSPASFHPRTYRLYNNEEKSVFLQDYRLTACMSLLKWFLFSFKQEPGLNVMVDFDRSSLFLIEFALRQLKHYIRVRRHLDIDDDNHSHQHHHHNHKHNQNQNQNRSNNSNSSATAPQIGEWDLFLHKSTQILQRKGKLTTTTKSVSASKSDAMKLVKDKYNDAKNTLKEMLQFWPQFNIDGMNNVWIFKPGEGSLGRGIIVLDQYEQIALRFIGEETQNSTWLAQKYVENPLLVKKTKFDIRQWFLISSWNPLTVWMYRQCYIRFASTDFRLDDLSEKIHLTNASVQQKYRADPSRDWHIPMNNMWCSTTFQTYLSSIGKPNVWKKLIYPEMKKIILSVLLATRPSIRHQERTFQILGADFLLSDDYKPWLIEINSCPTMSSNTSVKRKLCPQCIEDTFKVILDWTEDDTVDTGDFDLLYRAKETLPQPIVQKFRSRSLEKITIRGRSSGRDRDRTKVKVEKTKKDARSQDPTQPESESKRESESESDSEQDNENENENENEDEDDSQSEAGSENYIGNLHPTIEINGQSLGLFNSPSSTVSTTTISMVQVSSIAIAPNQNQSQSKTLVPIQLQVKVSETAQDVNLDIVQDQDLTSAVTPTPPKTNPDLDLDLNTNSNNEE